MRADATDDVAVASVVVPVNGAPAFDGYVGAVRGTADHVPPAPGADGARRARPSDFGGNSATAPTVAVHVIPDPLTTVIGTGRRQGWQPGRRRDRDGADVSSTTTAGDGSFSIAERADGAGQHSWCWPTAVIGGRNGAWQFGGDRSRYRRDHERRRHHACAVAGRAAALRLDAAVRAALVGDRVCIGRGHDG